MKPPPRRSLPESPKPPPISIRIEDPAWRDDKPALALIRRAARLALATPPHRAHSSGGRKRPRLPTGDAEPARLTILLTNDKSLRGLNAAFRGKDKPTNVLSFPASGAEAGYLGDIALAYGVVKREARAQAKDFAAHAAHLAAHGTLHLLAYDHENAKDAKAMETLEIAILTQLRIGDPYAARPYTARRKAE